MARQLPLDYLYETLKGMSSGDLRVWLTRIFIAFLILVIIAIYYLSEKRPFPYVGYDQQINKIQRYDAELNESIVQTRFGIVKNYDAIDGTLKKERLVYNNLNAALDENPDPEILEALKVVDHNIHQKELLSEDFKRINPILINAIFQFSHILYNIIDLQESDKAIERSFGQSLEDQFAQQESYQMLDNINNLFRGILTYINFRSVENQEKLENLVRTIKSDPMSKNTEEYPKLEYALDYADQILKLQPEINHITTELFNVPIVNSLNALNNAYRVSFSEYLGAAAVYRIILYVMLFVVLVLLRWTFSRIRRTVSELHVEVQRKMRAEKELELINRQLEQRIADRTKELTVKNKDLNQALGDLKDAQEQLIIQEKMASVGMLTTGIAHEIKNPLNFVNNFSAISVELIDELGEELDKQGQKIDEKDREYIGEILEDLKTNSSKIKEHGERADNIVKNMLLHSQDSGVQKDLTSIPSLVEENTQIALQSFTERQGKFDVTIEKEIVPNLLQVMAAPQALARVFSYVIDNALYAMFEKKQSAPADYQPTLAINITQEDSQVVVKIKDNGTGIPKAKLDKVFEPFYTTKPTGKGNTGLGLSICYDTVVKQHKGELKVSSEEGKFTEFEIILPGSNAAPQNHG